MGIGFVIIGIVLIVSGAQNTYAPLGTQLTKDFTGQGNFTYWLVSIAAVGALGYIPAMRKFSTYFMSLILLAVFLSKGKGFFAQFQAALASGPVAPSGNAPTTQSSSGPLLNLGPLGTINPSIIPGTFADYVAAIFGKGSPTAQSNYNSMPPAQVTP